jgi:hypothetical protein
MTTEKKDQSLLTRRHFQIMDLNYASLYIEDFIKAVEF